MELACSSVIGFPPAISKLVAQYYNGVPFQCQYRVIGSKLKQSLVGALEEVDQVTMGPDGVVLVVSFARHPLKVVEKRGLLTATEFDTSRRAENCMILRLYDRTLERLLCTYWTPSGDTPPDAVDVAWLSRNHVLLGFEQFPTIPSLTSLAPPAVVQRHRARDRGALASFCRKSGLQPTAFHCLPIRWNDRQFQWSRYATFDETRGEVYILVHTIITNDCSIWVFDSKTLTARSAWTFADNFEAIQYTREGFLIAVSCRTHGLKKTTICEVGIIDARGVVVARSRYESSFVRTPLQELVVDLFCLDSETFGIRLGSWAKNDIEHSEDKTTCIIVSHGELANLCTGLNLRRKMAPPTHSLSWLELLPSQAPNSRRSLGIVDRWIDCAEGFLPRHPSQEPPHSLSYIVSERDPTTNQWSYTTVALN
jgi:hypothetical protein